VKETAKLNKFESELQNIEDNLPLQTKYKNPKLGTESPIVVVNEIYAGGDVGTSFSPKKNPNTNRYDIVVASNSNPIFSVKTQIAFFDRLLIVINK
jgi:hypothetical protein